MTTAEPAPTDRPNVTLTLSPDEADTLALVMACVGGDPKTSRRRHTASIADALRNVGYRYDNVPGYRYGPYHMCSKPGLEMEGWIAFTSLVDMAGDE